VQRGNVTVLRCGGCGANGTFGQDERRYGLLVFSFLDRHDSCGAPVTLGGRRGGDGSD